MSNLVICINNSSNPASLIPGKVYRTIPDEKARTHNMLRILDEDKLESNGYLYPSSMFAPIELSDEVEHALIKAGGLV